MTNEYSEAWLKYIKLMEERPELFQQDMPLKIVTDWETVNNFEVLSGRKIGVVYDSCFNMMLVDLVYEEPQHLFCYERVVPANIGGIVVVPMFNGKFVLLNQFRHAIRGKQFSFPRGYGELGLTARENLEKELNEEIGATSIYNVKHLGEIVPDSGISGNIADVYYCEVEQVKDNTGYEGICNSLLLSDEELKLWITEGRITDAFTLGAYAMYKVQA